MIRLPTTLAILMLFSACGGPQTSSLATTDTPKKVDSTPKTHPRAVEDPFIAEDSIIGIGIVTLSDTADTYNKILSIYDTNGKVLATIEQQESDVITIFKGNRFTQNDTANPLVPRLYSQSSDYFRLAFDCIRADKQFYTVVINRETGQTGKIKKSNRFFKFELIEEFVENWAEIGVDFDRSVNPLREFASDTSEIIPIDPQSKLKTESSEKISIKGDWIEVQTSDSEKGWVRWRQGNQILIRLYYSY